MEDRRSRTGRPPHGEACSTMRTSRRDRPASGGGPLRVRARILLATLLGLLATPILLACPNDDRGEAVEEMQDEMDDAAEEIRDEVDDHT